jgi:hypothetical protein
MKKILWAVLVSALLAACGGGGSEASDTAAAAQTERAHALADPEVWTFIANEYQSFQVTGTQTVRYGSGSTWIQRSVAGSGQCTNAFFGSDPVPNVVKRCEALTSPPSEVWTLIANEYQSFQVTGTQTVRYGAGSTWIQRSVTDSGQCTNAFFGSDPVPNVLKRCEVLVSAPPPPPPGEVWTFIANEYQSFQVTGTQTVRYGAGSTWIQRSVTGSGQCTNAFFGSDPVPNVVKRCELLSSTTPPGGNANDGSPLGTNLAGLGYFATQVPFIDLFKSSSAWVSGSASTWDDGRAFDLDANGWVRSLLPGQIARTLMLRGPGVYPSGKYVVLYDGQGTLEYVFGWRKVAAESAPGRDVVEATGATGDIGLYITATNPANHVRNIRVLLPGGICGSDAFVHALAASACPGNYRPFEQVYSTLIFNPVFLERTSRYKVLRYMLWMETNTENQDGTWADRPLMTHARWIDQGGVPLEVMIELANRLNAYPWFNIPHRASDDYVRNFARFVRDRLNAGLKVYLEYSNETWNGFFPVRDYAYAQAQALGIAAPGDPYTSSGRYHARRAPQIFDLWASEFGGNLRLVRVLGGQSVSPYLTDVVAGFENAYLKADAIGLNAYFGLTGVSTDQDAERFAALTNAQALEEIRTTSLPATMAELRAQIATVAKYNNLKVMAFEGGNSLWPPYPALSNPRLKAKLDSIQRDPGMKAIYTEYLAGWFSNGGHLMMHFVDAESYSERAGWFGSLEYLYQPRSQAPKYDALMSFIDANRNRITP